MTHFLKKEGYDDIKKAPKDFTLLERDPLLTWAPTPPTKWKMNYFVPHFGADDDIIVSKASEVAASESLGHQWIPTKDEDGEWELPSEDAIFKI